MEIFPIWLAFSVAVGMIASNKGRSGFGWFVLAMLISPLIAGIFVLIVPNLKRAAGEPTPETHVRCPDCREFVLRDARVCKHCGCKLIPQ